MTIVEEDFTNGFGVFVQHAGNFSIYYTSAMNRVGVVCITNREGRSSTIKSNKISLNNSPFTRFRIALSFHAIEMEHSDYLRLDYKIENGATTGKKCWSSIRAFENNRWYDDKSLELAAANA